MITICYHIPAFLILHPSPFPSVIPSHFPCMIISVLALLSFPSTLAWAVVTICYHAIGKDKKNGTKDILSFEYIQLHNARRKKSRYKTQENVILRITPFKCAVLHFSFPLVSITYPLLETPTARNNRPRMDIETKQGKQQQEIKS